MSSHTAPTGPVQNPAPEILTYGKQTDDLFVKLHSDPPGISEIPGVRNIIVAIHVGRSVHVACRRGDQSHSGLAVHGDIDIIPANTPSVWEIKDEADTALCLCLSPQLVNGVAEELGLDARRVEIRNRFQVRDTQIENIGWAVKTEVEAGRPSGRLYLDSLSVSIAARLISAHSSVAREPNHKNGGLAGRRLKQVLLYIDDNLARDISLADVASVAGLSVSHLKVLFRQAFGIPVHQYLIRRRLERAKDLLSEGKLPISQIAFETGFAHQSHLARHMRRVFGVSPRTFKENLR